MIYYRIQLKVNQGGFRKIIRNYIIIAHFYKFRRVSSDRRREFAILHVIYLINRAAYCIMKKKLLLHGSARRRSEVSE